MTLREHIKKVLRDHPGTETSTLAFLVNARVNIGYTECRRRVHSMLTKMLEAGEVEKETRTGHPTTSGQRTCSLWSLK